MVKSTRSMTSELRLVQEIEKYECLYNSTLPDYNRKDLTEEAWGHVSYATNLTITECKEKWRNIRSSLLRSLKPSEKAKKPYYLSTYLTFVLPFMKPLNNMEYRDDIYPLNAIGGSSKDNDILICTVKSEGDSSIFGDTINEVQDTDNQPDPLYRLEPSVTRKRKKNNENKSTRKVRAEESEPLQHIYAVSQEPPRTNIESMHYFLMSLIPEFETMSEEQTRVFKIKVMMLLDDIKSDYDKVKDTMASSSETNRLNKRLINLLIRNLEKKT